MKRSLVLACALLGLVALEGCATVKSTRHIEATSAEGLTYFLPMRRARLTATRTLTDLAAATRAVGTSRAALTAAELERDAAKVAHDALKADLDHASDEAIRTALQPKVAEALTKMQLAQNRVDRLQTAFDQARATVDEIEATGAKCTFTAKVELLPSEPDPAYRFVAMPSHNILRDDTTTLTVTSSGLLSSANAVAVDRTGDIIVEMAGAIAGGGVDAPGKSMVESAGADSNACAGLAPRLVLIFDPAADLTEVNDALKGAKYPLRLHTSPDHNAAAPVGAARPRNAAAAEARFDNDADGALYYRSPTPVLLSVQQMFCASGSNTPSNAAADANKCPQVITDVDWRSIDAAIVLLPQRGPVSYVPMNSSAFVRTVDNVVFTDGVITSWTSDRPSEALEIVRLPVEVLQALISVPAQLLQLRVNYSSQAEALAANQQAEIAAQERLRALEACLAAGEEDVVATCLAD